MEAKELVEKLLAHPKLKSRVEQLLAVVDNVDGEVELADEAERRVIEEMRLMGQEALQSWAYHQSTQVSCRAKSQGKNLRKHRKKNSAGIRPMEK